MELARLIQFRRLAWVVDHERPSKAANVDLTETIANIALMAVRRRGISTG
ncbi:MAG: hypothetical protein V4819_05990 [Verrucomicrobiota bacterium]